MPHPQVHVCFICMISNVIILISRYIQVKTIYIPYSNTIMSSQMNDLQRRKRKADDGESSVSEKRQKGTYVSVVI